MIKLNELVDQDVIRVDIIATISIRLLNYLSINKVNPSSEQLNNLQLFIKLDFIPNDIRLTFLQDIVSSKNTNLKKILNDPEVSMLLLSNI